MKKYYLLSLVCAATTLVPLTSLAQAWRCPAKDGTTLYTNDRSQANALGCSPMTGGNVTIIQSGASGYSAGAARRSGSDVRPASVSPSGAPRVDASEQRARDSDARGILEAELHKAEGKLADLQKEYNNGQPERMGDEARNYQKYIDRVERMRAEIARTESDINGIRRELGRAPVPSASALTLTPETR